MYLYCIEEGQGSNLIIINFEFFTIIKKIENFDKILNNSIMLKPLRYYVNLNDVAMNMFPV
jgi:hypothetical protein